MITKPTVFVLGAGASVPYGFPSGKALVDHIIAKFREPSTTSQWNRLLLETAAIAGEPQTGSAIHPPIDFTSLWYRLRLSKLDSIDTFLERNPQLATLGKRAIAQALIEYEDEEHLYPTEPELKKRDWYRYLFNHIFPPRPEHFKDNRIKIITFNFDRSFEYALTKALMGTYGGRDGGSLWSWIPVTHIHGDLCPLHESPERREYSNAVNPSAIHMCAQRITLGHEPGFEAKVAEAHDWLRSAEQVCFLGFGFHESNLDRLDLPATIQGKPVWCTRFGLGNGPVGRARRRFDWPQVHWCPPDWDIAKFLDETPVVHEE